MELRTSLLADLALPRDHDLAARPLLRCLGAAQDGQFSTRQAAVLDIKPTQVLALRDAGEIEQRRYSVWRFVSAAGTPDPAITAFLACWPAGVISRQSAATFHGLKRIAIPASPHITVLHGQTCRPSGISVHHTTSLPGVDVLKRGPVRYTSLARTTCDLANPSDPWETLAILDDAVALGAARPWLHARAVQLSRGRGGVELVAKATSPTGAAEFRSWLEHTWSKGSHPGGEEPAGLRRPAAPARSATGTGRC